MGLIERDKIFLNIFREVCTIYVSTMPTELRHPYAEFVSLLILYIRVKYGLNLKNIFVKIFLTILEIQCYK